VIQGRIAPAPAPAQRINADTKLRHLISFDAENPVDRYVGVIQERMSIYKGSSLPTNIGRHSTDFAATFHRFCIPQLSIAFAFLKLDQLSFQAFQASILVMVRLLLPSVLGALSLVGQSVAFQRSNSIQTNATQYGVCFPLHAAPLSCTGVFSVDCISSLKLARIRWKRSVSNSEQIYGPGQNLTESQLYKERGMSSFWIVYWLTAENGHDYFAVASQLNTDIGNTTAPITTYTSLLDITTQNFTGVGTAETGQWSITSFDAEAGGVRMYAASDDMYSTMIATSSIPGATFNLTSEPVGPLLYHAGSGIFTWGTDITYEWAAPQMKTSGTITVDGEEINIIPEQSTSWYDRQYGPGFATSGWVWGMAILDNGLIFSYCHNLPVQGKNKTLTFSTILYPDGHHEVNELEFDMHLSERFISPETNLPYYQAYQVNVPRKGLVLDVKIPIQAGEMAREGFNSNNTILFEAYATINGTINGEYVTGYGVSEQKHAQGTL